MMGQGRSILPLSSIPVGLRDPLIAAYNEIEKNFRERRWEPSSLNGGKLCEICYCILRGCIDGRYPTKPSKPRNFIDACRQLEQADKTQFSQSIRVTLPRILIALYEIRNNRGVGHAGGDVDPNHMDASFVLNASKWVMAELVRHFHQVNVVTATAIVETLIERTNPLVWQIGDVRRVLRPQMNMKDKTLILLHSSSSPLHEEELFNWVEHTNKAVYRRDVLKRSHREKLLEYNEQSKMVSISPLGIEYVEGRVLAD